MANNEPDQEVQDLLRASPGDNLGMDFLPGSVGIETPVDLDPGFAADVLWFDAFVQNVDRSWRNPNMLRWHGAPWLIDHGASLYFHHDWSRRASAATKPYPGARDHLLLPVAGSLASGNERLAPLVTEESLRAVTAAVPDGWLEGEEGFGSADEVREAYVDVLLARLGSPQAWLDPLEERRAAHV